MARLVGHVLHISIGGRFTHGSILDVQLILDRDDRVTGWQVPPQYAEQPYLDQLSYMDGWPAERVIGWCMARDWKCERESVWDPPIIP